MVFVALGCPGLIQWPRQGCEPWRVPALMLLLAAVFCRAVFVALGDQWPRRGFGITVARFFRWAKQFGGSELAECISKKGPVGSFNNLGSAPTVGYITQPNRTVLDVASSNCKDFGPMLRRRPLRPVRPSAGVFRFVSIGNHGGPWAIACAPSSAQLGRC